MRRTNTLARGLPAAFDRTAHWRRDANSLERARRHPGASVLLVHRTRNLARLGEQPGAVRVPLASAVELRIETRELIFLGVGVDDQRAPVFALDVSEEDPTRLNLGAVEEDADFVELRQLASVVPAEDANLMATARALATWHFNHRRCGRCGDPTRIEDGGHLRRCPACGFEIFPRTDPAVIMLVHDGADRCLLGRQASWPEGVYSTLAGFVEPGESLEMAVAREVLEETGVEVTSAIYHSSQPWPFPTSVMLGFWAAADYADGEIAGDDDELEDARWFESEELHELRQRREVRLPPRMSIARRLVDDWLEERTAGGPTGR